MNILWFNDLHFISPQKNFFPLFYILVKKFQNRWKIFSFEFFFQLYLKGIFSYFFLWEKNETFQQGKNEIIFMHNGNEISLTRFLRWSVKMILKLLSKCNLA